jgi:hypothetical protein
MKERRRVAAAAFFAVLLGGASRATTLLELGFPDLARQADRIVIGTVTRIEGRWDSTHRFIHSDVTLSVEQSLRGDTSPEIVLRTLGGYVGSVGQLAHGAATFEVGERVLVFLTAWEDGVPKVLGYAQGKSRIVSDGQGRERLQGGSADGRNLLGVLRELRDGPDHNIPLRPSSRGGP